MDCDACHGNGIIDCPHCTGNYAVRTVNDKDRSCQHCHGTKIIFCNQCNGRGVLD